MDTESVFKHLTAFIHAEQLALILLVPWLFSHLFPLPVGCKYNNNNNVDNFG